MASSSRGARNSWPIRPHAPPSPSVHRRPRRSASALRRARRVHNAAHCADTRSSRTIPPRAPNCHVMTEQFDEWNEFAHRAVAPCNDISLRTRVAQCAVKATNGFWHSFYFTAGGTASRRSPTPLTTARPRRPRARPRHGPDGARAADARRVISGTQLMAERRGHREAEDAK